jgi:hypothetical protein
MIRLRQKFLSRGRLFCPGEIGMSGDISGCHKATVVMVVVVLVSGVEARDSIKCLIVQRAALTTNNYLAQSYQG